LTLNGRCDAQYYIKASTENNGQWIVQKDRDLESCRNSATGQPEQAGRWRTFVQMSSCSSTSSNTKSQDSDGKTAQVHWFDRAACCSLPLALFIY
jgi:hypothetical protein